MKSAKERADDLWCALKSSAQDALDYDPWMQTMERAFHESNRDQRHFCAEAVNNCGGEHATMDKAHAYVMNAPFPGEG